MSATGAAKAAVVGTQAQIRGFAADALGLGFGGVAVYGFATGRVAEPMLTTAIALAAVYLGLKLPVGSSATGSSSSGTTGA